MFQTPSKDDKIIAYGFAARKFLPLMLVSLVTMAYMNSFQGGFVYDDYISIVNNDAIKSVWSSLLNTSRPLTNLTFSINYLLGNKTADYHLLNIVLHAVNALLLFGIVRRALESPLLRGRWSGVSCQLAGAISSIWAIHPLQTESVTYIVQRAEVLAGTFYLLTLYLAIRGMTEPDRQWVLAASIIACALGMTAKPVMVTAPLAVLLYDRTFHAGSVSMALRRRWGLYLMLGMTWVVLVAILIVPNESSTSAGIGSGIASPLRYLATQTGVILYYLWLAVWPHPLCLDYGWELVASFAGAVIPAIVTGSLLIGGVCLAIRRPGLGFPVAWFFIILAPTSSMIPLADCAAEHRMYLPLAGIISFAVICLFLAKRELVRIGRVSGYAFSWVLGMILTGIVIVFSIMTIHRNEDYRSELAIWNRVLEVRRDNIRAYLGKGTVLLRDGRFEESGKCFQEILKRIPDEKAAVKKGVLTDFALTLNNVGVIAFSKRDYESAEYFFSRAAAAVKGNSGAERNLAMVRKLRSDRK